jgi:hypothetical protein
MISQLCLNHIQFARGYVKISYKLSQVEFHMQQTLFCYHDSNSKEVHTPAIGAQ